MYETLDISTSNLAPFNIYKYDRIRWLLKIFVVEYFVFYMNSIIMKSEYSLTWLFNIYVLVLTCPKNPRCLFSNWSESTFVSILEENVNINDLSLVSQVFSFSFWFSVIGELNDDKKCKLTNKRDKSQLYFLFSLLKLLHVFERGIYGALIY